MKIIEKFRKLYENLAKVKYPNCSLVGFTDNILKKTFIEKKIESKSYQKNDTASLRRGYSNHPRDGRFTTEYKETLSSTYD